MGCLRSIFVPEDETFLLLFRAPSIEVVEETVSRAEIRCEHISAAASATTPSSLDEVRPNPTHPSRKAIP